MKTDIVNISQRLAAIAAYVPARSRLADIGSDHALLPVFLCQTGRIDMAIAGELNPGPLQAALRQVSEAGLGSRVSVRQGSGLDVIEPGEAEVITIAGMGGSLIVNILREGHAAGKLQGVQRLILQPNVAEDAVRRWLFDGGWTLTDEQIVEEDDRIYEIVVADREARAGTRPEAVYQELKLPGGCTVSRGWLFRLGPFLVKRASPVFRRKWIAETQKLEMILASLAQSGSQVSQAKAEACRRDIDTIREVLACLPQDKPSSS